MQMIALIMIISSAAERISRLQCKSETLADLLFQKRMNGRLCMIWVSTLALFLCVCWLLTITKRVFWPKTKVLHTHTHMGEHQKTCIMAWRCSKNPSVESLLCCVIYSVSYQRLLILSWVLKRTPIMLL